MFKTINTSIGYLHFDSNSNNSKNEKEENKNLNVESELDKQLNNLENDESYNCFANKGPSLYDGILDTQNSNSETEETNDNRKNLLRYKISNRYGYRDNFKLPSKDGILPFFLLFAFQFVAAILDISTNDATMNITIIACTVFTILLSLIPLLTYARSKEKILKKKKIFVFFIIFYILMFGHLINSVVLFMLNRGSNYMEYNTYLSYVFSYSLVSIFQHLIIFALVIIFAWNNVEFKTWFKKAFSSNNWWITLLIVAIGFAVCFGLEYASTFLKNTIQSKKNYQSYNSVSMNTNSINIVRIVNMFIAGLFVGPLFVEIFYRYFVLLFCNYSVFGIIASIIYYSIVSLSYNGKSYMDISYYIPLGLISAIIYYLTRNLVPCMLINFLLSLVWFILSFTN